MSNWTGLTAHRTASPLQTINRCDLEATNGNLIVTTEMKPRDGRPPVCDAGHAIVASAYYPPSVTGSSVLMYNLLSQFDPSSYTVATAGSPHTHSLEREIESDLHEVFTSVRWSWRVKKWMHVRQIPLGAIRLAHLIQRKHAAVLIAVYPDYPMLAAAHGAAKKTGVPWAAYFHDTMAESQSNSPFEQRAADLQKKVFSDADKILVMSQGMADLYREKYGLNAQPVVHTYPEVIPETTHDPAPDAGGFWSGTIYRINQHAFARVSGAFERAGESLFLATNRSTDELRRQGISGAHLRVGFFPERAPYLAALRQQKILVQALDWPDESPVHRDELATIFPTKTPEYLASGCPMLVHCPGDYFLASFVRDYDCGLVVDSRDPGALDEALDRLLTRPDVAERLAEKARSTAKLFEKARVAQVFRNSVTEVTGLKERREMQV